MTAVGSRILHAPVRLTAVAGGRSLRFAAEAIDEVASDRHEVVLEQRLTAANLDLRVQAHVEFDGMIRFDVEVSAADAVDLDSLSIEIPVRAEHAEYLYHFSGGMGDGQERRRAPGHRGEDGVPAVRLAGRRRSRTGLVSASPTATGMSRRARPPRRSSAMGIAWCSRCT